jgi:hypothetical protein
MDHQFACELNLALIPDEALANRHVALSKQMAQQYPTVIQLNGVMPRVAFAPHVTLYQVPVRVCDLPELRTALSQVASKTKQLALTATEYGSNANEGSFEIRYDGPAQLMDLQSETIAVVNPLRGDLLLERDPAGREMRDRIEESGTAGDNIRATGFDAVGDPTEGGLFHAHVTINWFELGTAVALPDDRLPTLSHFDGRFRALGIFLLGPYGTCAQRLAALRFAA